MSDYKGTHEKVLMRHNNCGHEWLVTPNDFIDKNTRCPKCAKNTPRDIIYYSEKVNNLTEGEYEIIDKDFINYKTPLLFRHIICGYEWNSTLNDFINKGRRCPKCAGNLKKDTSIFKQEIYNLVRDEYSVLGEYVNSYVKIRIKHNICNNTYKIRPSSFLYGRRCPFCNESKGEIKIRKYFDVKNITYIKEYTFVDLLGLGSGLLRFDFAIFDKDKLKYLVEYDGEQHFKYISGFMTKKDYEILKIHDKLKNEYCKNNNIKLIRIPYWDFNNIEKILDDAVN